MKFYYPDGAKGLRVCPWSRCMVHLWKCGLWFAVLLSSSPPLGTLAPVKIGGGRAHSTRAGEELRLKPHYRTKGISFLTQLCTTGRLSWQALVTYGFCWAHWSLESCYSWDVTCEEVKDVHDIFESFDSATERICLPWRLIHLIRLRFHTSTPHIHIHYFEKGIFKKTYIYI